MSTHVHVCVCVHPYMCTHVTYTHIHLDRGQSSKVRKHEIESNVSTDHMLIHILPYTWSKMVCVQYIVELERKN